MLLLGIETSCDDTATAVVRDGEFVLSNVATHQDSFHAKYGGIVPEIASRQHVALLSAAVDDALSRAGSSFDAIDGIAVTRGPGLSAVSSSASRRQKRSRLHYASRSMPSTTSTVTSLPRSSIVRRSRPFHFAPAFRGGRCSVRRGRFADLRMLVFGRTHDDAAGEACRTAAGLLGLKYAGGPAIRSARRPAIGRHRFPRTSRRTGR